MIFTELSPEDFRNFADKSLYRSFYQTPEIAKLRESNGWIPYYFGIKENDKILAATILVARPAFLGKSVFYAPGGPLIDFENRELLNFFTKNLKKYLRSHNAYVLHIEPYYELIERDRDGEVVAGGFDHQDALKNLKSLGYRKLPESDEPAYQFVLDIKGRTPDELLASFKRNTRNHIRKAEKKGVKIRELNREELPRFKKITESTSRRRDFSDKPLKYYEQMYDLFHERGEIQFLLAEADGHDLSAAMFMTYGSEVIYLFSGSAEEYMREYNAQYLIQWHMIKFAAEHGYEKYNFYGIHGLPDRNDPDYGIYDFKKGFGGRVVELIGAHELPISPVFYYLHSLLAKLRH